MVRNDSIRPTLFTAKDEIYPIETARAFAVLLLVSYHVIGARNSGLQLTDLHPLRLFADFFVDLRMPLFASISGAVYALRPVPLNKTGSFILGKFRRLALPGLVAITVSMAVSLLVESSFASSRPLWQYYLYPFLQYWFLQVLLIIMLFYCPLDILTKGKALFVALPLSWLTVAVGFEPDIQFFSFSRINDLLPYFLLGVVIVRYKNLIYKYRSVIMSVALVAVIAGAARNILILNQTGQFSADRTDLQTLFFALGGCILAFLALPTFKALSLIGPYSYSIYLYHLLATSGTRRALDAVGIENVWLHLVLGVLGGVLFPVVIHVLAMRSSVGRRLVLGLKS